MATPDLPPVYRDLDFNAPLSAARADRLIRALGPLGGRHVVDVGCGWAELLLRALATEPTATGFGIDLDGDAVAHGRAGAAARGLADRVELVAGDAGAWSGAPADVVLNVGSTHVWGGEPESHTGNALAALHALVRPGGRVLLGECFWQRVPTPAELAAMPVPPDQYLPLPDLVDLALSSGFRLLAVEQAGLDEWDDFENRHAAGREEWLHQNPGAPDAAEVRARADAHRVARLRGWRETMGFAYLTLLRG